jgi:hypothetical protein
MTVDCFAREWNARRLLGTASVTESGVRADPSVQLPRAALCDERGTDASLTTFGGQARP